jgi:hypothetical protein
MVRPAIVSAAAPIRIRDQITSNVMVSLRVASLRDCVDVRACYMVCSVLSMPLLLTGSAPWWRGSRGGSHAVVGAVVMRRTGRIVI